MTTALAPVPPKPVNPLRRLRVQRGLTGAELAHRAGVRAATIFNMETGRRDSWPVGELCRLADVLNVSADVLLGREPPLPAPVDALNCADRELLEIMERDAVQLFGPDGLKRAGGWRRIARFAWQGALFGIRARGQDILPRPAQPLLAAVRNVERAPRYRRATKAAR